VRFDHLGVVVPDLAAGRFLLRQSLGIRRWTPEFEERLQDVYVQFGQCPSGMCYELIAPRSPASPVSRALKARVNTLNHVAYLVEDLAREAARLGQAAFVPVSAAKPGAVFGNRPIQFFVSPGRLMLELIEAPDYRHAFISIDGPATGESGTLS
jgi:methylmalonyl-CoA/ethylmalonyl-CoA epimerase